MSIIKERAKASSDNRNQQEDVEKVIRSWDQTIVASYAYDAWGNPIEWSGPMAERNPIRYRGYYYDTETGFYYLQSRYYDPQTGRFINADGLITTGQGLMSYNMFAYCLDNPVNYRDGEGDDAIWIQEEESAYGAGHTGLMVQDEEGNWWYFYWGPDTHSMTIETEVAIACGASAKNGSYMVRVDPDKDGLASVGGVKRSLYKAMYYDKNKKLSKERINAVSNIVYLNGDYTETYAFLKEYSDSNNLYNLYDNNCVQVSLRGLSKSNHCFTQLYSISKIIPHPNWLFFNLLLS